MNNKPTQEQINELYRKSRELFNGKDFIIITPDAKINVVPETIKPATKAVGKIIDYLGIIDSNQEEYVQVEFSSIYGSLLWKETESGLLVDPVYPFNCLVDGESAEGRIISHEQRGGHGEGTLTIETLILDRSLSSSITLKNRSGSYVIKVPKGLFKIRKDQF